VEGNLPVPALAAQAKDQGAWSSLGRRKAQEDTFLLHEIHGTKQRSVLLAGVMDGHLGIQAASHVRSTLPDVFSEKLILNADAPVEELLEQSWKQVCDLYRSQCSVDQCAAEYDAREGSLAAFTGSEDAVAGTTTCIVALDMLTSNLITLNCGDSRAVIMKDKDVIFQTTDHTPGRELNRFEEARKAGMLDYAEPVCRLSTWRVPVGEYNYAVSRSLEGEFASSRGTFVPLRNFSDSVKPQCSQRLLLLCPSFFLQGS